MQQTVFAFFCLTDDAHGVYESKWSSYASILRTYRFLFFLKDLKNKGNAIYQQKRNHGLDVGNPMSSGNQIQVAKCLSKFCVLENSLLTHIDSHSRCQMRNISKANCSVFM